MTPVEVAESHSTLRVREQYKYILLYHWSSFVLLNFFFHFSLLAVL